MVANCRGEKLSPEEAEVRIVLKGLRFQLIEGRAMAQSDIKITFEDLKTFTTKNIRQQMAQFGQTNPTDAEVQGIVARVLSNQDEVKDFLTKWLQRNWNCSKKKQINEKRLLTMNLLLPLTENKFSRSQM
jgi:hypothetical protein